MFAPLLQALSKYAVVMITTIAITIISYQQIQLHLKNSKITKQEERIETLEWEVQDVKDETEIKTTKVIVDYMKRKANEDINETLSNTSIITGFKRL